MRLAVVTLVALRARSRAAAPQSRWRPYLDAGTPIKPSQCVLRFVNVPASAVDANAHATAMSTSQAVGFVVSGARELGLLASWTGAGHGAGCAAKMCEPQRRRWGQHLNDRRLLQRLSGVAVDGAGTRDSVRRK